MTRRQAVGGTISVTALVLAAFAFAALRNADSGQAGSQADNGLSGKTVTLATESGKATTLTGKQTEEDHPAVAAAEDGTVWTAYLEYTPGGPVNMQQAQNRNFESLVPEGNGDRVLLRKFDGKKWQPALEVTKGGLRVWRPTVAVDGDGNVVVAWAQKQDGNWEILSRTYMPAEEKWSDIDNVSESKGSDFHVVSATDSKGKVWLAWQRWKEGRFGIAWSALAYPEQGDVRPDDGNFWSPDLAADSKGNVYLAFDYYDGSKDGYNIRVQRLRHDTGERSLFELTKVLKSPKTLLRPNIVCDDQDRLWIAYEEGNEQWGKDFQGNRPQRVGIENLGYGLYIDRTIRVRCLENGKLKQPKGDLQKALGQATKLARSLARLQFDKAGGLWLLFRHHPKQNGRGEIWVTSATRFDGKSWSEPQEVPHSEYIIDNRTALAPHGEDVLAVYSTDSRKNAHNRGQNDVVATVLKGGGKAADPQLAPFQPKTERDVEPVHPDEAEDVARMRNYRIEHRGKELKLLRGEFHRHTEYTAHRDQDGLLEDSWRYALDAGQLDWMGNGDHDNGFGEEFMWWQIQKYFDLLHNPPGFTSVVSYERSVRYPSGHRNVILPKLGIRPLPRLRGNNRIYGTPEEGAPDVHLLYDYLQHFDAICALHTSGTNMGTDWRDNHPGVEPIVEIYQAHRHNYEHKGAPRAPTKETQIGGYRPKGYVWNALQKGYRLGFQSSSDHVGTHMSYAVVLAEESSRKSLIEAFKKRHSYGATDNIILDVRSGKHLMGDEFQTGQPPTLEIKAIGTAPVARVHVIRDNEYVHTVEPKKRKVELRYTDADAQPGESHYYYVRVEQADKNKNLAWSSPMWITYEK